MTPPKISILVPCYNVEKYIRQCMDSVVNQTLRDIEIIAINDGSTDGTLAILQEYAARDDRVKIIDKENEGYGKSMNRGLDAATGEYIGIVESDDWAEPEMFAAMTRIADANDVDLVKGNILDYYSVNGEHSSLRRNMPANDCGHVISPRERTAVFYASPAIWSAIYRRDFLVKNNIRFVESPGASYQDTGFNIKCLAMATRVYLTDAAYLHYRRDNENSSVKSSGKIFCVCDEWAEIERYLTERGLRDAFGPLIATVKLGTYLWNRGRLTDDARAQFVVKFGQEYDRHIKNGEFKRDRYDDKTWASLMRTIYPHSQVWRAKKHFYDIVRPVYKTYIRNGCKYYCVFGRFVIKKKQLANIRVAL